MRTLEKGMEKTYEYIVRPSLLGLVGNDPERLHNAFLWLAHQIGERERLASAIEKVLTFKDPRLQQNIWGLDFPNPLALAAGFYKNAIGAKAIPVLGVGSGEIGTATPLPQPGYSGQRIWYLFKEKALANRMGFPNDGADIIAGRLEKTGPISVPVIVSIGKGINTRVENAVDDYTYCLQRFYPCSNVSGFSGNVSCPHMLGLRELRSDEEYFRNLISTLKDKIADLASEAGLPKKPLLVKISPDDSEEELRKLLDACLDLGVEGIIAVNTAKTTLFREDINVPIDRECGKSGKPLFKKAVDTVEYVSDYTEGKITIVGVGGIFDAEGAYQMFRAGARLVQVYTGYVYQIWNPFFFYQMNKGIAELMKRDGVSRISDIQKI